VGTSQRQDVMDLLEKRIRSRFSHRRILLGDPVFDAGHRAAGRENPVGAAGTPLGVLAAMLRLPASGGATEEHHVYAACFNDALEGALAAPQAAAALRRHFYWDMGASGATSGACPSAFCSLCNTQRLPQMGTRRPQRSLVVKCRSGKALLAQIERLIGSFSDAGASPAELATLAMHIMDGLAAPNALLEPHHVAEAIEAQDAFDTSQVCRAEDGTRMVAFVHQLCIVDGHAVPVWTS